MLNKWTCKTLSLYGRGVTHRQCLRCKIWIQNSSRIRTHVNPISTPSTCSTAKRTGRRQSTTVIRTIRHTGQLPTLPDEPVVKLSQLPTQRQPTRKNIIADDLKATVDAHKEANTLARGYVSLDLQGYSSLDIPKKFAIDISERNRLEGHRDDDHITSVIAEENTYDAKRKTEELTELHHSFMTLDRDCNAFSRLDAEIRALANRMQVTAEEDAVVQQIFKDLEMSLKGAFPKFKIEIHGSRATGLARPLSDIDIRLFVSGNEKSDTQRGPSPGRPMIRKQSLDAVKAVKNYMLRTSRNVYNVGDIRQATIPLLDLRDKRSQLDIQIAATSISTDKATEFTKYYQSEYPQVKPLFILLRWWARQIDLDDASRGGVSSYLMFNMIITSITHSKELYGNEELGRQLINFFEFWSKADTKRFGYAPDPPRIFPKYATNIVKESFEDAEQAQVTSSSAFTTDGLWKAGNPEMAKNMGQSIDSSPMANVETRRLGIPDLSTTHLESDIRKGYTSTGSDNYFEGIKYLTARAHSMFKAAAVGPSQLLLQDLADPRNNVGRSAQQFKTFQNEMQRALAKLRTSMKAWNRKHQQGLQTRLPPASKVTLSSGSHSRPTERRKDYSPEYIATASSYLLETLLEAGSPSQTNTLRYRLQKLERGRQRVEAAQQWPVRRVTLK